MFFNSLSNFYSTESIKIWKIRRIRFVYSFRICKCSDFAFWARGDNAQNILEKLVNYCACDVNAIFLDST